MNDIASPNGYPEPDENCRKAVVDGAGHTPATTITEPFAKKPAPDPFLAPGCFGAAFAYEEEAMECRSCPFEEQCAPKSQEKVRILRAELGSTEIAARNGQTGSRKRQSGKAGSSRGRGIAATGSSGADPGGLPTTSDWEAVTRELKEETERRAAGLDARVSNDRHDKRLVKLRGRTRELVGIWLVRQVLKRMTGVEPTAVEIAREYNKHHSASVSARSMRRRIEVVESLENPGQPWDGSQQTAVEPAPSTTAQ